MRDGTCAIVATAGCDETAQAASDGTWAATCLTDPLAHGGPLDLLRCRYRAIEHVPASALAPVAGWPPTYFTAHDLGEVAANIELRTP